MSHLCVFYTQVLHGLIIVLSRDFIEASDTYKTKCLELPVTFA